MMQFLRKNTRSIMMVIVVVFVVSCFAGYGMYFGGGRGAQARGENGDYVVAKINGKRIMRSALEAEVSQMLQSMGMAQNISSEDFPAIRKGVLEQMAIISEMEKEIKARNIKALGASVDEALKNIEASFPTREIYLQQMQQAGLDEKKLKGNIEDQIKQGLLFEAVVSDISVDVEEVRSYYDTMAAVGSPNLQKQAGFTMNLAHFATAEVAENIWNELKGKNLSENWDEVMNGVGSGDILGFDPYDAPVFIPSEHLTGAAAYINTQPLNVLAKPAEIASGDFLLVVKRTEQKAGTATYEEISKDIELMLRGQKGQAQQSQFIRDLRQRAEIEIIDEDLFKTPEAEAPETDISEGAEELAGETGQVEDSLSSDDVSPDR